MKPQPTDRIFPIVALCTVVFGCLVFSEGRADIRGIPRHDTFRRAEYPFARVLETCTSWRKPDQVSNTWGPVSFRAACQQHDKCFHTLGTSWSSCNRDFFVDLRTSCDRDLKRALLEAGKAEEPDASTLRLCYEVANLFHAAVQKPGVRERFRFAQEVQTQYLEHVEASLSSLFQRVAGRVPSDAELAAAKEALDSGMSFLDIERSLASRSPRGPELGVGPEGRAALELEADTVEIKPVILNHNNSIKNN